MSEDENSGDARGEGGRRVSSVSILLLLLLCDINESREVSIELNTDEGRLRMVRGKVRGWRGGRPVASFTVLLVFAVLFRVFSVGLFPVLLLSGLVPSSIGMFSIVSIGMLSIVSAEGSRIVLVGCFEMPLKKTGWLAAHS